MANRTVGIYAEALKRHGGVRSAVRKYGIVRFLDIVLRAGWDAAGMRLLGMLGRNPVRRYGRLEALLAPSSYYWLRYTDVIAGLNKLAPAGPARLVEVASGGSGGIAWAMGRLDSSVCLVDRSADLLADPRGRGALRVCADGCTLPFRANAFDVAVSLDTVEHLPRGLRPAFIEELKRVAKRGVIITCPLVSADDLFQAGKPDSSLSASIAKRDGVQPTWLQEHLQQGHPTREELLEVLPGAQITGSNNCDAWLRFALLQQRLLVWLFTGVYYLLFLRKQDHKPPYRQALLVWDKQMVARTSPSAGSERVVAAESSQRGFPPSRLPVTSTR